MLFCQLRKCLYDNQHAVRNADADSPCCLPQTAKRLPAAQAMIRVANYLIYWAFWPIGQAFFGAESNFLPALREALGASARSAGQALGAGRDVVEGERHRHTGVKADQADHVCDALMA